MQDEGGNGAEEEFPLSPMQGGMLYQALLEPQGGFDIEQVAIHLHEPVDAAALALAWQHAADRHDALRVAFRWEGLDQPVQRILRAHAPTVIQHDWSGIDDEEARRRVDALLDTDRHRGFDLRAPPWRVHLCVVGPARAELLWSIHHLVLDGRSVGQVLLEVFDEHAAAVQGRPPAQHQAERGLTAVLRGAAPAAAMDESRAHWSALLGTFRAPTPLPSLEPASRPLPERGAGAAVLHLDEGTTAGLHALAVQCEATVGAVVHALWALVLARFCGETDVVFGTTRSTRRRDRGADDANVIGMFINTLPVRVAVDDERSLRDLISEVRQQTRSMQRRDRDALVDITRCSGVGPGVSLFDSVVMFDVAKVADGLRARDPSWQHRAMDVREQPAVPLVLTAYDGPRLKLRLLYQRRRARAEVAERMVRHLEALARRAAQGGQQKLGQLDGLPDAERRTLVDAWNDTARPFPEQQRIHQAFEARVDLQPDAIALRQGDAAMTYAALEEAANRLAHLLRQRGAAPGQFVGICLERTPSLVVALLGVAKSGAAYVPIDPSYPRERIDFMLSDSGAELVITERASRANVGAVDAIEIDGAERDALAAMPGTRPEPVGQATDVCYAIYTSGSTGQPKGVVLSHRAVVNTLDWVSRTFSVGPGDQLLFVTSPCFDLSVYDTFGALGAGATVEIASSALLRDPAALTARLVDGGITIWDSAPQALQRLVPLLPAHAPRARLRLVLLSGDWIPLALPPRLQRTFPGVAVHSLGGATEAAIWSNWFPIDELDPRWTSVPYGRPIQNARYHVLDRRMRPVPPGVPGDLYIGGTCLAEGYLRRPELTAERFVADPFREREHDGRPARLYKTGDLARYFDDGKLEFLGRADFQVKVRGFRVELGEVEAALRLLPQVAETVCVARRDASGEQTLWAYVTLRPGAAADAAPVALRRALATHLPDFMVPAGVLVLEAMPVSANGKLDRAALPDPAAAAAPHAVAAAETPTERRLVDVWTELLARSPIGIDDNFFDLGGHSLLATMMVARLKSRLDVDLPLARVLAAPTIRALAQEIDQGRQRGSSTANERLVALNHARGRPPLLLVSGVGGHVFTFRELASLLEPDQPVSAFTAIGTAGEDLPRTTVPEVAAAYDEELRRRGVQGPLLLGGYSFGTLVAFELAHRLRARGVEVVGLVSIDSFAPGHPQRMPPVDRVLDHLRQLYQHDTRGRVRYLRERLDNLRHRALFRLGRGHQLAPEVPAADAQTEERLRLVWAASIAAQRSYRPTFRDPGPLLLFEASEPFRWPATLPGEATKGWRHFVDGRIDVVTLPGSHLQLFTSDNARRMARAIHDLDVSRPRGGSRGS